MAPYFSANNENCIDYAIGNGAAKTFKDLLDKSEDVPTAFVKTCSQFGISVRNVGSLDEADFGIAYWQEWNSYFMYHYTDYHVIRKDGEIWMHKPDIHTSPSQILDNEIQQWRKGSIENDITILYYAKC